MLPTGFKLSRLGSLSSVDAKLSQGLRSRFVYDPGTICYCIKLLIWLTQVMWSWSMQVAL